MWPREGWYFLNRENFVGMLGECPEDRSAFEPANYFCFAYVDVQNIEALYQEFRSRDVRILIAIGDEPWGSARIFCQNNRRPTDPFGESI